MIDCFRVRPSNDYIAILVLDDEPDIVTILKEGLGHLGFHVFAFTDPNLALEHFGLNYKNYGLVISDIRMPQMNGFEFIKKVKQIKPAVRVFFMTAFEINEIEFSNILPSVSIDEFIQKPVTLERLGGLISEYISPHRY